VVYTLTSQETTPTEISLDIQNSFSPALLAMMDNGRSSAAYFDGTGAPSQLVSSATAGVKNLVTGSAIHYLWGTSPDTLMGREDVFGLELNPRYTRTLAAGGSSNWSFSLLKGTTLTEVHPVATGAVPAQMELDQNYPNPFNPTTVVSGQWSVASVVRLAVYDILGREVAVLADGRYPAGKYSFSFDGSKLSSGTYFCRLTAGSFVAVRKMTLLK